LLYTLEQGPVERTIIESCMREGLPLPQRIENAPELAPGLEFYLAAFYELESSRPMGLDVGPIPWTALQDYALSLGLDDEEQDDLKHHVRALDVAYLKHRAKK
jgi:hypothetical protein